MEKTTYHFKWGDPASEKAFQQWGAGFAKYDVPMEKQIGALLKLGRKDAPCRCMDIGCGYGNQAIQLAKMGYAVSGIDISEACIEKARENALKENVEVQFDCVSTTELMAQQRFEFAYSFYHTLGYLKEEELVDYFHPIADCLTDNGLYFLHLADCLGGQLKIDGYRRWDKDDSRFLLSERYSDSEYRIEKFYCIDTDADHITEYIDKKRWHSAEVIRTSLINAGFRDVMLYKNFNCGQGDENNKRIVLARK